MLYFGALRTDITPGLQVYVEGPYGSPMIDVHGIRYKAFVLVAGGIGWTFLRSWRRQLLQDACRGRPVKAVTTVTVLRGADQHQAEEILDSPAIDGPLVLPNDLELQVQTLSPMLLTRAKYIYNGEHIVRNWPPPCWSGIQ